MFNLGSINSSRFNGALSYSTKRTTSKKDRKGCKKEKIDSILKDKMVSACRPPTQVSDKKPVHKNVYHAVARTNFHGGLKTNRKHPDLQPPPPAVESAVVNDPYSFTDQQELQPVKRFAKLYEDYQSSQSHFTPEKRLTPSYRVDSEIGSILAKKLISNDAGKPSISKLVRPAEFSPNRSNLVFSVPQNKCKTTAEPAARNRFVEPLAGTAKFSPPQPNVPTSKNILLPSDFGGKTIGKVVLRPKRKQSNWRKDNGTKHEALQRIDDLLKQNVQLQSDLFPLELSSSEDEEDVICDDRNLVEECLLPSPPALDRELRLAQVKHDTCKKLQQTLLKINNSNGSASQALVGSVIKAARVCPSQTAFLLNPKYKASSKKSRSKDCLMVKRICSLDLCQSRALPGARYCMKHILYSVDQQLFSHCSGKMSDNTQCPMPVFDIKNISPLCLAHAKQIQEIPAVINNTQSKKPKKKSKSIMSRQRGKKRRKVFSKESDTNSSTSASDMTENFTAPIMAAAPVVSSSPSVASMILRRGEEVFLTDASVPVTSSDLDSNVSSHCEMVQLEEVAEELVNSRLLDDHEDLTTVLNQLPADAFSDLFSDKNGQYIPTREETEELERALEAVDKDVRCLERMTRTHIGIYDTVNLHPAAIPEDLNPQLYPGYPNGYAANSVALTSTTNPQKL